MTSQLRIPSLTPSQPSLAFGELRLDQRAFGALTYDKNLDVAREVGPAHPARLSHCPVRGPRVLPMLQQRIQSKTRRVLRRSIHGLPGPCVALERDSSTSFAATRIHRTTISVVRRMSTSGSNGITPGPAATRCDTGIGVWSSRWNFPVNTKPRFERHLKSGSGRGVREATLCRAGDDCPGTIEVAVSYG